MTDKHMTCMSDEVQACIQMTTIQALYDGTFILPCVMDVSDHVVHTDTRACAYTRAH